VADRARIERAEFGGAHVAEVIAERVARIGRARTIAEDVGVAVKLDAELSPLGERDLGRRDQMRQRAAADRGEIERGHAG